MPQITIPYKFTPREYQLPFLRAMESEKKRAVLVWHRRAGKDKTVFNFVISQMMRRVGNYYYMFPTYAQGKKAIWEGKDQTGMTILSHGPRELLSGDPNNTEMKFTLKNGSLFQMIGTENIDNVRGSGPCGLVYSEYSMQDPKAFEVMEPALLETGGWAVFVYTPMGKNHGYKLYELARNNPEDWFCERLTVEDTQNRGGTMTVEMVEKAKIRHIAMGKSENFIRQEYYCDFNAAVENAVFGEQILYLQNNKRFTKVPWEPKAEVETYWDIGWDDSTAIWFVQQVGREIRLIDYYEARLAGPDHYLKVLKEKPYRYNRHVMPHDADYGRMETGGKSLRAILQEMGLFVDIAKKLSKEEQISNARLLLPRCWFDEDKCQKGIDALSSWHFDFDEEKKILGRTPKHDWSSHAADGFCLIGAELRDMIKADKIKYPSLGLA